MFVPGFCDRGNERKKAVEDGGLEKKGGIRDGTSRASDIIYANFFCRSLPLVYVCIRRFEEAAKRAGKGTGNVDVWVFSFGCHVAIDNFFCPVDARFFFFLSYVLRTTLVYKVCLRFNIRGDTATQFFRWRLFVDGCDASKFQNWFYSDKDAR